MKRLLRWLAGGCMLALLLSIGALWLALQSTPQVSPRGGIQASDVEHALQFARDNDPRHSTPGQLRSVVATQHDINLLLNHAARRWLHAQLQVQIDAGSARVQGSWPLRWMGRERWLNVDTRWTDATPLPLLQTLQVGRLALPTFAVAPLLRWWLQHRGLEPEAHMALQMLQRVRFGPGLVQLAYRWKGDAPELMLAALVPPAEQARFKVYAARLVDLAARYAAVPNVSLARMLAPMFDLAQQRTAAGGDAAQENRAALVTLAFFVNGRSLGAVVPAARAWAQPRAVSVVLAGRDDFPRHFLVSAVLAIEGTSPLAAAVGLYKEVADSRGGSGFSFNDMAANHAGARFGEWAMSQPEQLQQRMAAGVPEAHFMPAVADLPEFMSEAQLMQRFGGVGGAAYKRTLGDIERRVNALPLYR
jgi:hypothetical protein